MRNYGGGMQRLDTRKFRLQKGSADVLVSARRWALLPLVVVSDRLLHHVRLDTFPNSDYANAARRREGPVAAPELSL